MLLTKKQLREGAHLRPKQHPTTKFKTSMKGRPRKRRYALCIPIKKNPWTRTSSSALRSVFGVDALGAKALSLFQSALQPKTYANYGSNMTSFFTYCEENAIPYLDVTTIDIARYIAWMGERGTVATDSL